MSYFVEVHSMAITLKGEGIKGREIFGVVYAVDNCGTVEIFNKSKESCKPILADGTLYLTGPGRAISIHDLSFFVDLKDKNTDHEVSNGCLFVPSNPSESWFAKPISFAFPGDYGRATLYLSMHSYAVEVSVEVKLVIDSKFPPSKRAKMSGVGDRNSKSIHGTLYAKISGQERIYHHRTLFSCSAGDPEPLVDPDVIRLSRCIIVVPMRSSFSIEADLWDGTVVQVAKGTADFVDTNTDMFTTDTKQDGEIKGEEGACIKLEVIWHKRRYFGLPSTADTDM